MHGDQDLIGSERQMRPPILDIKIGKGHAPSSHRTGDFDRGIENHQSRCEVAAERCMTVLTLRRHVTNTALAFETIIVRTPPPFALIEINAASLEAEIAAYGCQA